MMEQLSNFPEQKPASAENLPEQPPQTPDSVSEPAPALTSGVSATPTVDPPTTLPPNSSKKRPVSERKILANRKNAQSSTGPKTARGKRNVSRNAITRGFLTREVVITDGEGEESLEQFHALVEQLAECYKPVGVIEETLVQTIATTLWRKARVIRAENGEIRKRLDTVSADRDLQSSEKSNLAVLLSELDLGLCRAENQTDQKISTRERWSAMQIDQNNLCGHRRGLEYLRMLLDVAKFQIARDGYMSEEVRKKILLAFFLWDAPFALVCRYAGPEETKMEGQPSGQVLGEQTEQEHQKIIAVIDEKLEMISTWQKFVLKREKLAVDAEARSFSLPPADAIDKLLRYEAHLDRQFYRAMDQLERLQRQRLGENVPPPLTINLGKRS